MKTFIFSLLLLFSLPSMARVYDAASAECDFYRVPGYPVYSVPAVVVPLAGVDVTVQVQQNTDYMVGQIFAWTEQLNLAGDPLFSPFSRPVCVGVYDDLGAPNARAFGNASLIIMGAELMTNILFDFQLDFKLGLDAVLAHEFAHNIQYRRGIRHTHPLPMVASKFMELQADCIAGVVLETHRDLTPLEILEASRLMTLIADSGFVGDHGTATNRVAAFNWGVEYALTSSLGPLQQVDHLLQACSFERMEKIIFPEGL